MMFLSDADLQTLTGRTRRKAQIAWLRARRVKHYVNALGYPVVAWAWLDAGGEVVTLRSRPNLSALPRSA